jgi:uncharacterized protein (DUF58 family)
LIFTDQIELYIPPKKGRSHILRLIRELLYFKMPQKKTTNIPLAVDYLGKVARKRATVFIVSDFIGADFKKSMGLLNKRHDVIAVHVSDKAEVMLPDAGIIEFADAETGETLFVDTSSKSFREKYRNTSVSQFDNLKSSLKSIKIDCISISTDKPYIHDLMKFFHMRHQRY